MKDDFDKREYSSLITIPVPGVDGGPEREAAVSHAAYRLHVYATVMAEVSGSPGFVSDSYLAAVDLDTTTATDELVVAGLWERRPGGYAVLDAHTVEFAEVATRWADAVEANCINDLGHVADPAAPDRCARCHGPMPRADGALGPF